MKKILLVVSAFLTLIACKENKSDNIDKEIDRILYAEDDKNEKDLVPTKDNYEDQFASLIKKYDSRMRVSISKQIEQQLVMYQSMLTDLSEAKKTSLSDTEFNSSLQNIQKSVLKELVDSELIVNVDYYDFITELNDLTLKYQVLSPRVKLSNYEELHRIELSQGVVQKINELALDETDKGRTDYIDGSLKGMSFLAVIPYPPVALFGSGVGLLSEFSSELGITKKREANGFYSSLDKKEMLAKIKANLPANVYDIKSNSLNLNQSEAREVIKKEYNNVNKVNLELESDFKKFHNIQNEIKGRIGDYSDGIWTVHYQNLLKIKDSNLALLKK